MSEPMSDKLLPRILLADSEGDLPLPNRYQPSTSGMEAEIPNDVSFEHLLSNASCENESDLTRRMFVWPKHGRKIVRFEVAQFKKWGVTKADVEAAFNKVNLRPANILELLVFVEKFRPRSFPILIALGSSTEFHLSFLQLGKSPWKKFVEWFLRRDTRILPSFPCVLGHCTNILRLTDGKEGWQPHCLFLGVHTEEKEDKSLVDLAISAPDYDALPEFITLPEGYLCDAELGFRFKSEDGHVCELVLGSEMFEQQWSSLAVPERGLRHYRPVFIEVTDGSS